MIYGGFKNGILELRPNYKRSQFEQIHGQKLILVMVHSDLTLNLTQFLNSNLGKTLNDFIIFKFLNLLKNVKSVV